MELMARASLEPTDEIHRLVYRQFTETGMEFFRVLRATVPHLAPDEIFATMDNANASFDLQTANVARRLSIVRLSRRIDRKTANALAQRTTPARDTHAIASGDTRAQLDRAATRSGP